MQYRVLEAHAYCFVRLAAKISVPERIRINSVRRSEQAAWNRLFNRCLHEETSALEC